MAGHKGYGFAVLAEILSGVISGGAVVSQVGSWMADPPESPSRHAAGMVAVDVASICDRSEYEAAMRSLVREIHEAPTAAGVERVLLPGEREWSCHRAAESAGIPLPMDVRDKLAAAAALVGLDPPA
jgi:LDH2 family malate/lactate/ureidoglycolate dehydrogenase